MRQKLLLIFSFLSLYTFAQDSTVIKVHFLYGSKPNSKYKHIEPKWFGGMLGGHVGLESDSGRILNFVPKGKFHWFGNKSNPHSTYAEHSIKDFYSILGGNGDSVKTAVVIIVVTVRQKQIFDSIACSYLDKTPYDYALFGMRCGAATYEILGQMEILPAYSYKKTYKKIFYPKRLRKRLFKMADENGWTIVRQQGSTKRKWEND